ncbi:uncharacterized protein LOC125576896 [Brassica napus]|uniref:uncharacterized protein LOC125576896 n=1 Tax=Brassica napus TaxID=3708 RepID=UPI002078ABA9|nr:uncharacterized protein LOC125576896 [Brassica napus]
MLNRDDPKAKEDSSSNVEGEETAMVPESGEASRDEANPSTIDKYVAPGTEQSPRDADEIKENASEKVEEKESSYKVEEKESSEVEEDNEGEKKVGEEEKEAGDEEKEDPSATIFGLADSFAGGGALKPGGRPAKKSSKSGIGASL